MRTYWVLLVVMLAGCSSNGFVKHYEPQRGVETLAANPYYVKPPKTPQLCAHSNNVTADAKRLSEAGYALIGVSSFFGPPKMGSTKYALKQGRKVGASLVLLKSTYKGAYAGLSPLVLPGAPADETVKANGPASLPTASTLYSIPYNVARSDFVASYWVLLNPAKMRLGARTQSLPDQVRIRLKRNTGVYVGVVVRGTPAFAAKLREGDIITEIDDTEVIDGPGFLATLGRYHAGQTIDLTILRDPDILHIPVPLN